MARFTRLDNQAPVQSQLEASNPDVSRSAFDFSFVHSGNTLPYLLAPVDCFDVVPNEDVSISIADLVEFRNPSVRPLLNGFRVYFHAYYNRLSDLWEGAKNFLDTGRSGKISLTRPRLIYTAEYTQEHLGVDYHYKVNACTPMSLLNFLGLPVEAYTGVYSTSAKSVVMATPLKQFSPAVGIENGGTQTIVNDYVKVASSPDYFPADCAFAYQRNWRDYYCNKNLLQENKQWFPDNEDHFILSYSCESAMAVRYEDEAFSSDPDGSYKFNNLTGFYGYLPNIDTFTNATYEANNPSTVDISGPSEPIEAMRAPNLSGIKFRQFRGDRFTTALPFPDLIRGDIPALTSNGTFSVDLSGFVVHVPAANVEVRSNTTGEVVDGVVYLQSTGQTTTPDGNFYLHNVVSADNDPSNHLASKGLNATVTGSATASTSNIFSISANDIRALETFTVFRERMARTNGDYNEMIKAQYGVNPHVHDHKGTYIGGFFQDFNMSVVTQTSESSSDSALGSQSANMYSNGSGSIGNFHVPDFGWIQIYMSIVSDVMYTQGVPRMFSKKVQTDMYFPIFNNLAPQAILNKELFVSGVSSVDNDVFAYEDRYAEYKSRTNRVSGFMSLSHSVAAYDASRVMSRRFSDTPALNHLFVTGVPENVDYEVFTVVDEPPFDFSCGVSVRRVFPGPYTAVPGSLSSNLHA